MVKRVLREDAVEPRVKCDVFLLSDKSHIRQCILKCHAEPGATNNCE
jgi:hypothetical protein